VVDTESYIGADDEEPLQAAINSIAVMVKIDLMNNEIRMVFSCEIFVSLGEQ